MAKTKELTEAEIQENSTALRVLREQRAQGIRAIPDNPRELYVADRKFVVIKPGARLEGILEHGKFWSGWTRKLHLGEVITCEGWRKGLDTDQEGVNWIPSRMPEGLLWCQVWPINGLFTPWPLDGFLRPLAEEE